MEDGATLGVVIALSAIKHLILIINSSARRQPVRVGHVTRLVVYPVKSMKGIDVCRAECHNTGLEGLADQDSPTSLLKDRFVSDHCRGRNRFQ